MKRLACFLTVISCLAAPIALGAEQDDAQRAAAIAEKQEQEERARRIEASIRDILAAQEEQQKRLGEQSRQIDALREENRRLRDDLLKAGASAVTREDLKKLADAISQVDERRVKDNRLLTEALEKLGTKLTAPEPPPSAPVQKKTTPPPATESSDLGYWHTIEPGQYLSAIVQAYREQGVKVTQKQVMDANPNVNWNRLSVGKKIFIPDPAKGKGSEKDENGGKPKQDEKP